MKTALILIIGIVLVICAASLNRPVKIQKVEVIIADPNYVQCPSEAQERLKAQGFYRGKIDGKWGRLSDEAYCNWSAVQEFRRVEQ